MKNCPTILFLYSELAEYFLACVSTLLNLYDVEVHIVRWELNKQAPFNLNIPKEIQVYSKEEFSRETLQQLANKVDPDLIFCCGWMDKDYVNVCKQFKKKGIPVVAGMDNQWKGTPRQYLAQLISRFTIKTYYSHIWVAGAPQHKYAKKLGFREDQILSGYYSADVDFFHKLYLEKKEYDNDKLNRRFIYIGRYLKRKGLLDLWEAFVSFQEENKSDWELWCLGTGPLQSEAMEHPKIKHVGFVQPKNLSDYIKKTDVFILPSHNEPWGVVVHEFAAAGFPLICSNSVGAASLFLEDGKNGYIFESGSKDELKKALHNITSLKGKDLKKMGGISAKKSQQITPKIWSQKLMSLLQ